MPSLPTVLVTDGEHRAALAITRSLGRAGYRVVVASPRRFSIAAASRWAADRVVVPDPVAHSTEFVEALSTSSSVHRATVLLPVADQSIVPVLENRSRFGDVLIPLPPAVVWHRLADKAAVIQEAKGLGILTPEQVVLHHRAEWQTVDLQFPVVVKPSRSFVTGAEGGLKTAVRYAADRRELGDLLAAIPDLAWPVLVQQRIVGPGMGVFLLMASGQALAAFGHRRVLEKPPSGGVSVWSESVPVAPRWLDRSTALLRKLNWDGVAMVEYKADRRSGELYLMEVNGRFWGSLQLAIDAGVDFPRLLVEHVLGLPVKRSLSWRVGVQCRWRLGELDHLIGRLRRSPGDGALPPDLPSLSRVLLHVMKPALSRKARGEVLRWTDPAPGVLELIQWVTEGRPW